MPSTLYAGVARRAINTKLGTAKVGLRLFADAIPGWMVATPEQTRLKQHYQDHLNRWLVEAGVKVNQNVSPARIGSESSASDR